ncbi:MAG TPA: hypothetical protein DC049_05655 [Spirochaetia bacterium]|nr:hypothetical protein [Spirochaetia bacterium]
MITDLLRYTRHGYHIDTAFFVSFIFIAICLYVIRRQFSENFTSKIIICAGLLLASVSYILFLPQWAMHHYGLVGIKHVAPIFGLLTGSMLFFLGIVIYRNFFLLWHKVNIIKSLAVAIPAIFAFFFVSRSMTRNLNDTLSMWASASKPLGSWEFIFNDIQPVKDRLPPDAYVLGNAMWRPELRYFLNRRVQIVESMDDFTFKWVNDISRFDKKIKTDVNKLNIDTSDFPHALEALIKSSSYEKYCNAAQTSGYFLFYKRWGEPENGFFPNYLKHEKELMAKSVTMYDWLEKNAIKVSVNKKWRLYKLVRLPPWPSAKNELRL